MLDTFMQFHFLRPNWLILLLFLPVLWLLLKLKSARRQDWSNTIDKQLLTHLMPTQSHRKTNQSKLVLICTMALSILAISGPTWKQKPQPVMQVSDDMVVILDLSLSMLANDVEPNRLTRMKHKLQDLLALRTEGNTALVAFSGDSHVVTPLTDDTKTILANLPALDPFMMPVIGSRPDLAINQAIELFKQAGSSQGRIILLTDGVERHQTERINDALSDTRFSLHILAVGTENGAPIDLPDRGYLKDGDQVVIAKTDLSRLEKLASKNNGNMASITLNDNDLIRLDISGERLTSALKQSQSSQERQFDTWEDQGYLLLLLIIPLVLFGYRQGALLLALLLIYPHEQVYAFGWDDLWKTTDQQAQELMQEGDAEAAAELFLSQEHKAHAQYQAAQFEKAEQIYRENKSASDIYNLGNALAKQQKFEEALAAYNDVLATNPHHEDAAHNKQIIEQIMQQQQSSDQQNQDQQDAQQQNSDQQQSEQSSDQNEQDQQDQSSQNQNNESQSGSSGSDGQDQQQNSQSESKDESSDKQTQDQPQDDAQEQQDESQSEQDSLEQAQAEQESQSEQNAMAESMPQELSDEEKQSFEQWMRRVPDDPGGLLRRKFEQQARERNRTSREQGEPLW